MQRFYIEWQGGTVVFALVRTDDHLDPGPLTLTQAEEQRKSAFLRPVDAHRFVQLRIASTPVYTSWLEHPRFPSQRVS